MVGVREAVKVEEVVDVKVTSIFEAEGRGEVVAIPVPVTDKVVVDVTEEVKES